MLALLVGMAVATRLPAGGRCRGWCVWLDVCVLVMLAGVGR